MALNRYNSTNANFLSQMVELMGFEPMSWQAKKIHLLPYFIFYNLENQK
jgi:hypothetical protein